MRNKNTLPSIAREITGSSWHHRGLGEKNANLPTGYLHTGNNLKENR